MIKVHYADLIEGIAVSAAGRKFSNYPPSLDANNIHYTVAELIGNTMEIPYPSAEINSPPGGRINQTTIPPVRLCLMGPARIELTITQTDRRELPKLSGRSPNRCYRSKGQVVDPRHRTSLDFRRHKRAIFIRRTKACRSQSDHQCGLSDYCFSAQCGL